MIRLSIFKKIKKDPKFLEAIQSNYFKKSEDDLDELEGLEEFANSDMSIKLSFTYLLTRTTKQVFYMRFETQ